MSTAFSITRRLPAADQRLREMVVGSTPMTGSTRPEDVAAEIARLEGEEAQLKRLLELRARVTNLRVDVALAGARGNEVHIILAVVAGRMNCSTDAIIKPGQQGDVVWPRHVVFHLARQLTAFSANRIGETIGGRDHGTVANSLRQVRARMDTEPRFKALVEALESECRQRIKEAGQA